jgi:hypothetical protein
MAASFVCARVRGAESRQLDLIAQPLSGILRFIKIASVAPVANAAGVVVCARPAVLRVGTLAGRNFGCASPRIDRLSEDR